MKREAKDLSLLPFDMFFCMVVMNKLEIVRSEMRSLEPYSVVEKLERIKKFRYR